MINNTNSHNQTEAESEETESTEPAETASKGTFRTSFHSRVPVGQSLILLAVVLFLLLGSFAIPKKPALPELQTTTTAEANESDISSTAAEEVVSGLPKLDVDVTATAAFVWDVQAKRVLYSKNPDEQLPLASITKLMTALVAEEILESGRTIPITVSAIQQQGESGFRDGEKFSLQELIDYTLMTSSNDGAYALASAGGNLLKEGGGADTFVQAMNIKAKELGLTQTYFRNPTGLDVSATESGGYGSARDVSFLMEYILQNQPQILERTRESHTRIGNTNGDLHESENTNHLVNSIPGLIGSKTGYTDLAGGNLVVAFNVGLNRPIVVAVLNSTRNGRFEDVAAITKAVTNMFNKM